MNAAAVHHQRHTPDDANNRRRQPTAVRNTPRSGDVLVSRRRARADVYTISVVPGLERHSLACRYEDAIAQVRTFAREHAVDGWYTADHTHFVAVARFRAAA